MAETTRTWSQVLASLADNDTGEIGAQDLKDALHSVYQCWGSLVRSGLSTTSISFSFSDTEERVINYDRKLDYGGIQGSLTTDDLCILAGGDGIYKVTYGLCFTPVVGDIYRLYLKKDNSRLYTHNAEPQGEAVSGQARLTLSGFGHITGAAESNCYDMWLGRDGSGNDTITIHAAWFAMERVG
jgi:hypothetical protein